MHCTENKPEVVKDLPPGDRCQKDEECFGKDGERKCDKNVCTTTRTEGSDCPNNELGEKEHKWCPLGAYCDNTNKCKKQVEVGNVCEVGEACQFGTACVKVGEDTDFKCSALHRLDKFTQFDRSMFNNGENDWIGYDSLCSTYHVIEIDVSIMECRDGDISDGITSLSDYKQKGAGVTCKFKTNSDKTTKDPVERQDTSICGFNKDTSGYCRMRKGDKFFQDVIQKYSKIDKTQISCHPESYVVTCDSFLKKIDANLLIDFQQANLNVIEEDNRGYPLYANNDKCVAKSITAMFWQGRSPDSGYMVNSIYAMALLFAVLFWSI